MTHNPTATEKKPRPKSSLASVSIVDWIVLTLMIGGIVGSIATYGTSWLAPEPLSPLFQSGGLFAGWNEDVTEVLIVMLLLAIIDRLIVRPFIHPSARYFFLHICANSIATIAAAPDVHKALFVNALDAWRGSSHTMWANSAIAAIHFYHCVAFKLSASDIFHHLYFVVVLCGLAIPLKHFGGVANNFGCFFLSGLPGGIDYVLLVLVKHDIMGKLTEKKWNAWINTWIRGPSMSIYIFQGFQAWLHGRTTTEVSGVVLSVVCGLHFFNGQYYAREACEGYGIHMERAKWEKVHGPRKDTKE